MFKGVNYVGIGVSDMDRSLKFYGDLLGFTEVMFDYTGFLPGMEKVTGKPKTKARVVMLKNQNMGPLGLGMIKLVHLLPPDKPEPLPADMLWGEIGVSEVALNTYGTADKFGEMVLKGCKPILTPASMQPPSGSALASGNFAYIADPDGGCVEFVDLGMCLGVRTEPTVEGVNHVGFGVSNIENSLKFYQELGFTELFMDYTGYLHGMATLFPEPIKMRFVLMANYYGGLIELVTYLPPNKSKDSRGSWGHRGPMEFGVGVSNLEKACEELQKKGIRFLSPPQTIEVPSGQWKYVYVVEPDNNYVSLIEPRY